MPRISLNYFVDHGENSPNTKAHDGGILSSFFSPFVLSYTQLYVKMNDCSEKWQDTERQKLVWTFTNGTQTYRETSRRHTGEGGKFQALVKNKTKTGLSRLKHLMSRSKWTFILNNSAERSVAALVIRKK